MPLDPASHSSVALLIATVGGAPAPVPERREAARKVATMTLVVSLVGVVVVTCLVLILMRRIRRRLSDGAKRSVTRHSDAWAEAGRRAGSPPPEAFER
ncbi:MAG: hypothetical protein KDA05_00470, partial [Phycisphaerales bacterium]|nr:hypothetical protein [Phycisphaerales bacterium]